MPGTFNVVNGGTVQSVRQPDITAYMFDASYTTWATEFNNNGMWPCSSYGNKIGAIQNNIEFSGPVSAASSNLGYLAIEVYTPLAVSEFIYGTHNAGYTDYNAPAYQPIFWGDAIFISRITTQPGSHTGYYFEGIAFKAPLGVSASYTLSAPAYFDLMVDDSLNVPANTFDVSILTDQMWPMYIGVSTDYSFPFAPFGLLRGEALNFGSNYTPRITSAFPGRNPKYAYPTINSNLFQTVNPNYIGTITEYVTIVASSPDFAAQNDYIIAFRPAEPGGPAGWFNNNGSYGMKINWFAGVPTMTAYNIQFDNATVDAAWKNLAAFSSAQGQSINSIKSTAYGFLITCSSAVLANPWSMPTTTILLSRDFKKWAWVHFVPKSANAATALTDATPTHVDFHLDPNGNFYMLYNVGVPSKMFTSYSFNIPWNTQLMPFQQLQPFTFPCLSGCIPGAKTPVM